MFLGGFLAYRTVLYYPGPACTGVELVSNGVGGRPTEINVADSRSARHEIRERDAPNGRVLARPMRE